MGSEDADQALVDAGEPSLPGGLAGVYPKGSRRGASGRLEIGGCDTVELAREFGTPAYVYAEDDMRERAHATVSAFAARTESFEVLYASKALPCTAAMRLFADAGLACDVASGGELHLALRGGFHPERIYMHGNNKTEAELEQALAAGVGHIVIDSFDEIERLERITGGAPQRVLLRINPGIETQTHRAIRTGQVDSKFGIPVEQAPRAIERCAAAGLALRGLHAHIGSQVYALDVYEALADVLLSLGDFPLLNLGGGFGIAYTRGESPPSVERYAEAMLRGVPRGQTVLCEPGRSLVGNAGVTLYTVGTVKEVPSVRTYVSVDGGMADNIRPMLYGAVYEADLAARVGDATPCRIAGMHCESGDVLVREAALERPRPGDVLVIPATGAYGHAMASNYNAVPRPPVIFCRAGDARVVVRRETYDDLTLRDR
ncbi:MAG: diaminopimelate decarboxylase [Thermoleophilaceae bacterium]